MLKDSQTCGDLSVTDQRLVGDLSATIPVMKKTVTVVAEVAIKIDRQEVVPRAQALWDRGLMYRVKYSTIPSEAHRKNADN